MLSATNNGLVSQVSLRLNESLKLTAKAEVVARHARENDLVLSNAPRNEIAVRDVVREVGHAAA